MNINELDKFDLADAVKFHDRLNPRLWGRDEHLLPQVRDRLLAIAADFQEFLGVPDLDVQDITVSGSNAAYSYTPGSDIDLHLVVRMPEQNSEVFAELFNAKKYQYNDEHDIRIGGADVELYVQPSDQLHHSQGIYSVQNNDWLQVPRRRRADIDDHCVQHKTEDLAARIDQAIETESLEQISRLWDKIKTLRQVGLDRTGEFGCDNLAFKMLRRSGHLERLRQAKLLAKDRALSLDERRKKKTKFRWGYGGYWAPGFAYGSDSGEGGGDGGGGESMREGHYGSSLSSEDGVAPSTQLFLNEDNTEDIMHEFIQDTAEFLGIQSMPQIVLHRDDDWSTDNNSFGMYVPDQHVLHVHMQNRHLMDVLRTTAHELAHCRQHEISALPDNAGNTGSPVENEAHAVAGIVMRNFADKHPELFAHDTIKESSGYIPTEAEKNDPRFVMALTADVRPGATGLNANRMALKTDSQGRPQLLRANGQVDMVQDLIENKIKLSTDPNWYGAEVGDYKATGPVFNVHPHLLVGFEPDDKMNQPKSKANVEKIVAGLKKGNKLPPLLVRKYKDGYQVLDGHHRFWAYKSLGIKSIPVQVVPAKDIEEINKQTVKESDAARTAKSAIDQTEVFGVRGYRARCLEPGCEWHSRSYDRIKQAQDSAKKHAAAHIKPGVAESIQHKKITELFDAKTSFPLKWDTQFASSGEVHAEAYDADGRTIDISFTPTGYGSGIEIVFKRGGSYDMTGHGDAPRVLATVVNAISQYLQKYQPPYIAFSAKSTGGRAGAYAAMIRRLARGYTLLTPDEYPEDTKGFLDFLGSDTPFILAKDAKMDTQGVAESADYEREPLYHATLKAFEPSIMKSGLLPGGNLRMFDWSDSKFVYLSNYPDIARDFVNPGVIEPDEEHEEQIFDLMKQGEVILKIDQNKLNRNLLSTDPHFIPDADDGAETYIYSGVIPPSAIIGKEYFSINESKQGVTEGAMKDLDIDLQDQHWDAIVGYVIDGLKNNMDIGRIELNLYQYAGREMFDVDQELENRGFRDLAHLAAHIQQNNGRYVPPRDFDLGEDTAKKDLVESLRQEFELLEDEFIGEIKMSPSNLRAEAARTGARAGMEFEMIVPGVESDDPEMEPNYDSDERCRSIDDAVEFFHDGDYNGRREVERLRERMQEDFGEWLYEKIDEDWANNPEEYIYQYLVRDVDAATIGEIIGEDLSDADGATKQQVAQAAEIVNDNEQQPYYDDARDWHREEYQDGWDESDWLDEQDLDVMSAIENAYEITWPHWRYDNESAVDIDSVAADFSETVGMPVNTSQRYHGATREAGKYVIEPDGSLRGNSEDDLGLEFVSPPMPIDQMLDQLKKVREWAGRNGCYTNRTTGLHINISVPEFSNDKLDYVKLALLLGDKYVLDQFGRSSNNYTKSALGIVQDRVRAMPKTAQALLDRMRGHMDDLATKAIHSGETDKFTSINTKEGYIEFRSPGGDWLDENFDKVENTLLRFTVALKAAMDPEAYREEYLKKLYKLLEPTAEGDKGADTVRYFADYVAGKIPAAALRSFVKQAQLQRRISKEPASGKQYWWRVYKDGRDVRNTAMIEVVASSEQEARDKAAAEFGIFSSEYKAYMDAVALRPYVETETEYEIFQVAGNRVVQTFRAADDNAALAYFDRTISAGDRPYHDVRRAGPDTAQPAAQQPAGGFEFELSQTDIENRLGWPDQTGDANYEVVNRNTQRPVFVFIANTDADALRKYSDWLAASGLPNAEDYGFRERARPGSTLDIQRRRADQSAQAAVSLARQQPATGGNFTGVWLILDPDGNVIHSFAGVGNVQSDANRVAMQWLRANPDAMQSGVTVVPEML